MYLLNYPTVLSWTNSGLVCRKLIELKPHARQEHINWWLYNWTVGSSNIIFNGWFSHTVVMLAKRKDLGKTKMLIEKHIYSSNRNKIQVNLVKQ